MKTYRVAALVLTAVLSVPAAAATMVMDPVTGVWYATTDAVYGVGAVAASTWNGAVHSTTATVHHTTKAVTPGATTVRHTAGHTTVRHHR